MIEIAIAVMNPAITAFDMKFEIQPIRARPPTKNTIPVVSASAAVNSIACVVLGCANPPTTPAETAATDPAAPNISSLDPPNRA
jgi:hypothetical protein